MTANNPRNRILRSVACMIGFAALLPLVGCKTKEGSATRGNDPLVAGPNRIPPQNIPVDRGGVGRGKTDPLLGGPTGNSGDRTGVGYSDDPARFKNGFVVGASTTPAALTSNLKDDDALKIDGRDTRVPLQQTGAVLPTWPKEGGSGVDALYLELAKYGVKKEDRTLGQENGKYVFRANVPISGNGAKKQYNGAGTTATEAVKQALDQVSADRR